jgi:hypothetical protein
MGHKGKEKYIFMVNFEDVSKEDGYISPSEVLPQTDDPIAPFDPPKFKPLISLNVLTGISAPHKLKLIGYINNKKNIVLINTH